MDKVLRGKGNLPSKWADDLEDVVDDQDDMDVSDDVASSEEGQSGMPRRCYGTCGERIGAL